MACLSYHGRRVEGIRADGLQLRVAALVRALGILWVAVFDGDQAGNNLKSNIAKRDFGGEELEERCHIHVNGDLEAQLLADGFAPELRKILDAGGIRDAMELGTTRLAACLRNNKTTYMDALAARIRQDKELACRAPVAFRMPSENCKVGYSGGFA